MEIQLDDALVQFHNRVRGTIIRGQRVDDVSLEVEIFSDEPEPHQTRYMLMVHFKEQPTPEDEIDEMRLVRRVFCEIPSYAKVFTWCRDEIRDWMTGAEKIPEWTLSDELEPGKQMG